MRKGLKKNKKGFTLVELIIVIAILAILAAVAIPSFIGLQKEAERGRNLGNASAIVASVNAYNALHTVATEKITSLTTTTIGTLTTANLWPKGMTTTDQDIAVTWVSFESGVATVKEPAAATT